jgi:hypothetical protein
LGLNGYPTASLDARVAGVVIEKQMLKDGSKAAGIILAIENLTKKVVNLTHDGIRPRPTRRDTSVNNRDGKIGGEAASFFQQRRLADEQMLSKYVSSISQLACVTQVYSIRPYLIRAKSTYVISHTRSLI